MKKEIIIILKEEPEKLPPIVTAAIILSKNNVSVTFICSNIHEEIKRLLKTYNITVIEIFSDKQKQTYSVIINKLIFWIKFRIKTKKILSTFDNKIPLWIGSGDTALALGDSFTDRKYILHLHELYDRSKFYKNNLKKYSKKAKIIVVPDNARAIIFRYWYSLNSTPIVIPNKPILNDLDKSIIEISPINYKLLEKLKTKKIILYQAKMIRMKLFDIAEALKQLGDDYVLGLLGDIRDKEMVVELLKKYENVVHFEYMFAPYHLLLTQNARIGILTYNYESLNNIFCAPNKTWEYSNFNIPMIANNLPLLKLQLEKYGAGETYEFNDIKSIKTAILKIEHAYPEYQNGSERLYNSVDMDILYKELTYKLFSNE